MIIKNFSIRIENDMLKKLSYIANYEGRSINSHILILIRDNIEKYEQENGEVDLNSSLKTTVKLTIKN